MIKPKRLQKGDKVAIVSLSSGVIGDEENIYRYHAGKKALEEIFGFEVVTMPNALKGTEWVSEHPELRAKDLMDAFNDNSIKAIITMTGGDDTVRLLPYIDYDIIRNNPKVFMGYSDTTANHFMMRKAGIVSFYGPALAVEFSLSQLPPKLVEVMNRTFFEVNNEIELKHFGIYANDPLDWSETKLDIHEDDRDYLLVQGSGKVCGELIGGCVEVMQMINGTSIWPVKEEWEGKILALETSEVQMEPDNLKWFLTCLGAQGIFDKLAGIIVGRPKEGKYESEYLQVLTKILKQFGRSDLPVLANCHFGHAWLWNILPLGAKVEIDMDNKKIIIKEKVVE